MSYHLHLGDCLPWLAGLPVGGVDAIVTDPPYGLTFMGNEWDRGVPGVPYWAAALRVLKPGGYLLAMGGSRTYHRLAAAGPTPNTPATPDLFTAAGAETAHA